MIQEKYNRRIYDEGTEAAIREFSHLRTNALSPVHISSSDKVLIFNPESTAIVEWLESVADSVVVATDNLSEIDETFDIYIPINKNTQEALNLIQKEIVKLSNETYIINEKAMLYTENGTVINTNNMVRFSGLTNGQKLLLV